MEDFDSILGLYSSNNYLTKILKEKFLNKYVDVQIFDDFLKIDYLKFSYLIINLLDKQLLSAETLETIGKISCKVIILAPYKINFEKAEKFNKLLEKLLEINSNLGIILIPEILGQGVIFNEEYLSHKLIKLSLLSERIVVGDYSLNIISLGKLIDEIIKETFSFGISGKKLLIVGFKNKAKIFLSKYLQLNNENIIVKTEKYNYEEIKSNITKKINFSYRNATLKSRKEFKDSQTKIIHQNVSKPKSQLKDNRYLISKLIYFIIFLIAVYLIPIVLILISSTSLLLSSKYIFKNTEISHKLITISKFFSKGVDNLNFNNSFYIKSASLITKINGIMNDSLEMVNSGNKLVDNMMGDEIYDLQNYSDQISANLDKIYKDVSFLQSNKEFNYLINYNELNINEFKDKIYNLKKLVSRLSKLLGLEKPSKYLLIFQNNMELRPTGGFIGSFAIVTFDKGRMTEIVISDVYSADGQLKGHVDPPEPIIKYLNQAEWFMRDSNWDPDFVQSSSKIKWFLDKEIDQKVDGVISIDLNFVQSLLKITGPINLTDFNKVISSSNLYDTTQSEVEGEFFSGSIKKTSFLTSLAKSLLTEIKNLPKEKYTLLVRELYNNLEERHIQINIDDLNSQGAVKNLNYAGEVNMNIDCGLRCIEDKYSLIDANLGVNKSNLFISREQELNLEISKNMLNHELLITYKNNAGQSMGISGTYKNYARLILPVEANIIGVRTYQIGGAYTDLPYDLINIENRKDLGFYFEVFPGSINKIQVVWNIPTLKLSQGGELKINIRKQAGTDGDNLKLNLISRDLSLTGKAYSSYNTNLLQDYKQNFFLK